MLYRVIKCHIKLYLKQIVNKIKTNSKTLWRIINNVVATKPISHSKINSVLDVHSNFVVLNFKT